MKLDLDTGTVIEGNVDTSDEVKMLIAEEAMPHIAQLLTNLYNDPLSAVFREYVANGVDAHKEAGIDEPVEVWIPNSGTPMFRVVDKGVGMSTALMRDIYSQYGLSTKQKTNFSIGGFGLGCKSALAITSQFTVTSVKDGVQTTAIVHNSEDGVSRLNTADVRHTDKPNGTVVSIPVKDHYDFSSRAYNFMEYFPEGSILINGDTLNTNFKNSKKEFFIMEISPAEDTVAYLYHRKSNYGYPSVRFIMGGVLYNIPDEDIHNVVHENYGGTVTSDMYELLRTKEIVIEAPVGSAKLSPSREGVQFNDRTKAFFREIYTVLEKEYKETLKSKIIDSPTYKDAVEFWNNLEYRDRHIVQDIKYNGVKITPYLNISEKSFNVTYMRYENRNSFDEISTLNILSNTMNDGLVFTGDVGTASAKRLLGDYLKCRIKKGDDPSTLMYIPSNAEFNQEGRTRQEDNDDEGNPITRLVFNPLPEEDLKIILGSETVNATSIEDIREEVKQYRKELREASKDKDTVVSKRPETKYATFESDGLFHFRIGSEIAELDGAEVSYTTIRREEFSKDPLQGALDVGEYSSNQEANTVLAGIFKTALGDNFVLVCLTGSRTVKALEKAIGSEIPKVNSTDTYKNSLGVVSEITKEQHLIASIMHHNPVFRKSTIKIIDPFFDEFIMETYNKVTKAAYIIGLAGYSALEDLEDCSMKDHGRGFMAEWSIEGTDTFKYIKKNYSLTQEVASYYRSGTKVCDELVIYMNAKYLANNNDA